MAGYNGATTMYGSAMVRAPQGFIAARDPNWELQGASEEQTSVFVEPLGTRILTAVGKIQPTRIGDSEDETNLAYWGQVSGDQKTITFTFSFQDVNIQDCYGIQVEQLSLHGVPSNIPVNRSTPTSGELCGDLVDDALAGEANYCVFNGDQGVIRFREYNNFDVIHTIHLFDRFGADNGYYTTEELFDVIKTKVKAFIDNHYSPNTINIELYVNTSGRIVFAWSGAAIKAAVGGLQIDLSRETSTILRYLYKYLVVDKVKRGGVTYGSVVDGDAVEFLRQGRSAFGDNASQIQDSINLAVAISPELTQFQRKDSITPIAAAGEIATFWFNPTQATTLSASSALGDLFAPKVAFDPSFTLDSFTVTLVFAANSTLLKTFLSSIFVKQQPGGAIQIVGNFNDNVEKRITLVVTARLF